MNSQSNFYFVFLTLQSSNDPGTRNTEDGTLVEHRDVIQDEATQGAVKERPSLVRGPWTRIFLSIFKITVTMDRTHIAAIIE